MIWRTNIAVILWINTICSPLHCGGLGLRLIWHHNRALLAKWLWKFGVERESLWHSVVVARFGELSYWEAKVVYGNPFRRLKTFFGSLFGSRLVRVEGLDFGRMMHDAYTCDASRDL